MEFLRALASWGIALLNAGHYILFKLRILGPPRFRNYPTHWRPWLNSLFRWHRTLRVVGAERCPRTGPAVFVSNHVKLDDPLFLWGAIERATAGAIHIYFMMRDDFFRGWPWDYLPFSLNELTASSGCIQISRDSISVTQLKPFLQVLERGGAFLMFPGRTRTRSGMCIEYRDGIDEPGGVSFFLAHGSRRAGQPIPAVPLARTHNPVTGVSTVVIGVPLYLETGADREAQREFDLRLAVEISSLTVVHMLHAVCLLLYLRCLHGQVAPVDKALFLEQARVVLSIRVLDGIDNMDQELGKTLSWLKQHGAIDISGPCTITPRPAAILATPDLDTHYRKANPVKFYCNQVMHLQDVVAAAEECVLGGRNEAELYVGTD